MAPELKHRGLAELFPQRHRSKGKHVSAAIHDIMKTLHPDVYGDKPIDITRANLGNALENAIVTGLVASDPGRYMRPGELEHEGWYGTPDLWDLGAGHRRHHRDWRTVEIKLTWYSLNRLHNEGIEGEWAWKYWTQLKAYCLMAGTMRGTLYICFVNGNYKYDKNDPESGPTILGWDDEWDADELQENWEMLKSRC